MIIKPIGGGFYECRSDDRVGVGASEAESYLNWYNAQVVII